MSSFKDKRLQDAWDEAQKQVFSGDKAARQVIRPIGRLTYPLNEKEFVQPSERLVSPIPEPPEPEESKLASGQPVKRRGRPPKNPTDEGMGHAPTADPNQSPNVVALDAIEKMRSEGSSLKNIAERFGMSAVEIARILGLNNISNVFGRAAKRVTNNRKKILALYKEGFHHRIIAEIMEADGDANFYGKTLTPDRIRNIIYDARARGDLPS